MAHGDDDARLRELARMRRLAGALLVVAAVIFVVAYRYEPDVPWLRLVRAAAEGAMVGAIADWFAVTALFRHPLGIPIPHTAIIRRRKDALAASIGRFVRDNFLTAEVIVGRMRAADPARRIGAFLARPEVAARLAQLGVGGIAGVLRVIDDADVQQALERAVLGRAAAIPAAPTAGRALHALLGSERRRELLHSLVQAAAALLDTHREVVRRQIMEGAPWWLPPGVDRAIVARLLEALVRVAAELRTDPAHRLYGEFDGLVDAWIERLASDPAWRERGELLKHEVLADPLVREVLASLWRDLKQTLVDQRDDAGVRAALVRASAQVGAALIHDDLLAAKVNDWLEALVRYALAEYADEASVLIEQTVRRWDAETLTRRIEVVVGRDLQFIRINGTIVGGLAGLLIALVSSLIR
ncbi:MAG: DUF445 family protein [Chloroflexi bacterium]|nr:DUF445 family protein [Chloroflexota bacterium]